MGSPLFRAALVAGALLTLYTIVKRVRSEKIQMEDSIFWVLFAVALVVVAIFPGVAFALAFALGIGSPSNFVFLVAIAVLTIKAFSDSAQISLLKHKVNQLSQEVALLEKEHEDR